MTTGKFISNSSDDSRELAHALAADLKSGAVIQLIGDLGAGKTEWVKGLVTGFASQDEVTSPSFSLLNEYRSGLLPVYHWDLYRLDSSTDWTVLDLPEQLPSKDGVTVVEWPERYTGYWPESTLVIKIEILSETKRSLFMSRLT